jgi:hypothetical protein
MLRAVHTAWGIYQKEAYMDKTIRELNSIKRYIPLQMYRTIMGQIKAGDTGGATVGIERIKRRLAKEDGTDGKGNLTCD